MAAQIVDAAFVKSHIGKMAIVDVRPKDQYEEGHIPTALNIPLVEFNELPSDAEAEEMSKAYRRSALGTEDPIIVYCRTGRQAKQSCDLLERVGYKNLYLYSGSYADWSSNPENPVEK